MGSNFHLQSPFQPAGDQGQAINQIVSSFKNGAKHHVLLGVTGSGKTFTMANCIQQLGKPTLIMAPNKTLAAQLYTELKSYFPKDHVGFFISYYDYYQPEAYVPSTDTYIAKDCSINDDIDKMRHESTRYLFEKKNTIIVASVSCIYGLGSPDAYSKQMIQCKKGEALRRDDFLRKLIEIQYQRNDLQLLRGYFRVRGDSVDVMASHQSEEGLRFHFLDNHLEEIVVINSMTGAEDRELEEVSIFPNSHYATDRKDIKNLIQEILSDLGVRLRELKALNKLVEFQRLEQRVMQDIETFEELGFCPGIENYSRYLTGKKPGEPPPCLIDYFPPDFLTIIDESHITLPQVGGMYRGDRSRKMTLVEFGFRLPSALDNRPLQFEEFLSRVGQTLYVSATPRDFEKSLSNGAISEQIIRPTGLLDPPIVIKPASSQVDDLFGELKASIALKGRVLITTLTKKMAEDLTNYYRDLGIAVKYLHADIDTLERAELLRGLRKGDFDVLVGINLLREGLDLPEVNLVAILDADQEGFLRSQTSLTQIVGRAARNHLAKVIFYADKKTPSMEATIQETDRRRMVQHSYNVKHGITPTTVHKPIPDDIRVIYGILEKELDPVQASPIEKLEKWGVKTSHELEKLITKKSKEMNLLAGKLDFEKAALVRDEVRELKGLFLTLGELS